jgi:hypothetical protein
MREIKEQYYLPGVPSRAEFYFTVMGRCADARQALQKKARDMLGKQEDTRVSMLELLLVYNLRGDSLEIQPVGISTYS